MTTRHHHVRQKRHPDGKPCSNTGGSFSTNLIWIYLSSQHRTILYILLVVLRKTGRSGIIHRASVITYLFSEEGQGAGPDLSRYNYGTGGMMDAPDGGKCRGMYPVHITVEMARNYPLPGKERELNGNGQEEG